MMKRNVFIGILAGWVTIGSLLFSPVSSQAADLATLNKMFDNYRMSISHWADAYYANDWKKATTAAQALEQQSKQFKAMADKEYPKAWGWETEGMVNHSAELVELSHEKEANDGYFVSVALFLHLNYVKAATPIWLREHLAEEVALAEKGVKEKNKKEALQGGEAIHLAGHDYSVSGEIMEKSYANTRWIKDARRMHTLGDHFQEAVRTGDWASAEKMLTDIKAIQRKIASAYKR